MKRWKRVQEQVPKALWPHTAENNSNLNCQIRTVFLPEFVDDWAPPRIENDQHLVSFNCFKNMVQNI